jgi:arylsulfatase A-like enzyme
MDSLTIEFALDGVGQLELGRRGRPDLLSVSLSTTDAVGHEYGPDSRELHDHLLRLDRWLGHFLDSLAVLVPGQRTVVALTADHGVQPLPEWSRARGRPAAARLWLGDLASEAGEALSRRYRMDFGLSFDSGLLAADTPALHARGVSVDSLARALTERIRGRPGVRRVFTPTSLRAAPAGDPDAVLWRNQLPTGFGWLLACMIEPGYVWSPADRTQAQHGSTAPLDVAVPIIFHGPGIRPGRSARVVRTVDIAPTLAALIGVTPTEPLDGRALPEIVLPPRAPAAGVPADR